MAPAEEAAAPAVALMQQMQGVYKYRFPNSTIDGKEKWISEDVVEIVPMDDRHIYVRAELAFGNGHSCSINGAAAYESGAFVFHEPSQPPYGPLRCMLRVSLGEKHLQLTDIDPSKGEATCRMYCGARGSLSDYTIARSARREIRYLPRLKASPQYQEALLQIPSAAPAHP